MRETEALAAAARHRPGQPRADQRTHHPAHENRRARRRRRQSRASLERIGVGADGQSEAGAARSGQRRAGTVAPALSLAHDGQDRQHRRRARRRRARNHSALHQARLERRQQRADLPRRHVAGVAPRRRIDAVVARTSVGVDRARDPQSARGDQLFGAAARRIAKN